MAFGHAVGLGRKKFLLTLALALAVSGCSFFRGPPPVTYDLSAPESIEPGRETAAQILIPEPSALAALNTDRIVVNSGPRISYYPDAQWPDRLPKLFQAKAIEAFERSNRARAVGRPGEGLSIDFQLLIDIRSFAFIASEEGGVARVEVSAKVLNDRNGRVIATTALEGEAPVVSDTAPAVVAGLDAALNDVLVELVNWTTRRL